MRKLFITAPTALALAVGLSLAASAAQATTPPATVTAVTAISHRPDGGVNGSWAQDNFTRTVTVHRGGTVSLSNCPGSTTGKCYSWTFVITDKGTFTTEPAGGPPIYNGSAPRTGTLDLQVTGTMAGGTATGAFFTDQQAAPCAVSGTKCVSTSVPATEDDHDSLPSGESTTTNWVEQFFPAGSVFNSAANSGGPDLGDWSWTYTLAFGKDSQCPNDAYRWVDSALNGGGSLNTDGNILAPNSTDCT
ncbi:MAG TPA: hypothetical protein VGS62_05775 [Streptosporangiaceae bacterium]|nr:hypothetical protein [Streptosporangiaceae bacterium]